MIKNHNIINSTTTLPLKIKRTLIYNKRRHIPYSNMPSFVIYKSYSIISKCPAASTAAFKASLIIIFSSYSTSTFLFSKLTTALLTPLRPFKALSTLALQCTHFIPLTVNVLIIILSLLKVIFTAKIHDFLQVYLIILWMNVIRFYQEKEIREISPWRHPLSYYNLTTIYQSCYS